MSGTAVAGRALDGAGWFVPPRRCSATCLAGAECAGEEVLGPVVTVETSRDEDEAVTRADATASGLSASVWTFDARRIYDTSSRLDAGTVWVKAHLVLANEVPWDGSEGSGYGRHLSVPALDDDSHTALVTQAVAHSARTTVSTPLFPEEAS